MSRQNNILQQVVRGIKDMCYIWVKEMRTSITDQGLFIFFILVPLVYPLIYAWIYNNEVVRDVPIAVVDMSKSALSRQFIRNIDSSADTKVALHASSLQEAKDFIGKQQVHGVIFIPKDFAKDINRGEQAQVSVYCDMSLLITYKAIYAITQAVASKMNKEIQITLSGNTTKREDEVMTQPLNYKEVPIFNPTGGYGNFIIPAVLLLILQQTLLLGIGMAAGTAREHNRYQDLIPISRHYNGIFRIVLGKSLAYFMIYAVMGAYITLVVPKIFDFTSIIGNRFELMGLMIPFLLACIFFGMTISCLIRYRENVIMLIVFSSLPILFMTGISWPQNNIPGFWQGISWLFPSTFGIRGFVRMSSMGANLQDVQQEYIVLWIQTLLYFFTTCIVYRYQIINTQKRAIQRFKELREKAIEAKTKNVQNVTEEFEAYI